MNYLIGAWLQLRKPRDKTHSKLSNSSLYFFRIMTDCTKVGDSLDSDGSAEKNERTPNASIGQENDIE